MKKIKITIILIFTINTIFGQVAPNKYWIQFTDKNNTPYSISNPQDFLTQKAIDRRTNQNITIVENDLPVNTVYIDSLESLGLTILNVSKWINAVTVYTTDTLLIDTIENISFIANSSKVGILKSNNVSDDFIKADFPIVNNTKSIKLFYDYGAATNQITMLNGHELHDLGYRGQGMLIAVIDAGFFNVDSFPAFDSLWANNQIITTRDFVNSGSNIFDQHSHGMSVLSIIAGNLPGQLVGTAPEADYLLLRSEDAGSEFTIEEDNWISAAEYADSLGVDIINTSLGYETFDDASQDYTYNDMDGNTAKISIGADIASSKGILVVVSAGNSGDKPWHYVGVPADADSVLTVGSVDASGVYSSFSSTGPTVDERIKPNITAQGGNTVCQTAGGSIGYGNGTSLSAPIITGLAACLWQANPDATNMELIEYIEKSASQYNSPDSLLGHGLPDFALAHLLLQNTENDNILNEDYYRFYPNPFTDEINAEFLLADSQAVTVEIFNVLGKTVYSNKEMKSNTIYNKIRINNLSNLGSGVYIIKLTTENKVYQDKILKN